MSIFSKTIKKIVINATVFFLGFSLSLLLAEGVCRLIYKPVNFLMPYRMADDILGMKIRPGSAGHDKNGFRNNAVPARCDVVAIGDSLTYGTNAAMTDTWPSALSKLTQKDFYNMSLPGYSPVKFKYLLETKALLLKPRLIIATLYYGNDLYETYQVVYTNNYWQNLRNPALGDRKDIEAENIEELNTYCGKLIGGLRDWLAHHSIFYRIFTNSLGDAYRFLEAKRISQKTPEVVILQIDKPKIQTGFNIAYRMARVNLDDARIKEGLRLCLAQFKSMRDICKKEKVEFLVVILPSKESVYAKYLEHNPALKNSDLFNKTIVDEREINRMVKSAFQENGIAYIDTLENLQAALEKGPIYFSGLDEHPNKQGYQVIADTVYRYLIEHRTLQ